MSHYSEVMIEFTDEGCLVAALKRLGFQGKVEGHREAQPLYGYQGDFRAQKAHLIIRREHVGPAANDLGFERQPDGKYRAWISEFDQRQIQSNWLGRSLRRVRNQAPGKDPLLTIRPTQAELGDLRLGA